MNFYDWIEIYVDLNLCDIWHPPIWIFNGSTHTHTSMLVVLFRSIHSLVINGHCASIYIRRYSFDGSCHLLLPTEHHRRTIMYIEGFHTIRYHCQWFQTRYSLHVHTVLGFTTPFLPITAFLNNVPLQIQWLFVFPFWFFVVFCCFVFYRIFYIYNSNLTIVWWWWFSYQ